MAVPVRSFDEALLRGFLARLDQLKAARLLTPVITLDRLRESLDDGQRVLVEQVIGLRPSDYGVDTPYAGDLEPVPSDLVTVSGQQYTQHGGRRALGDKYVPRHVFEKYTALNDAFTDEHPGRRLLIESCYRSPAYQVAVFGRRPGRRPTPTPATSRAPLNTRGCGSTQPGSGSTSPGSGATSSACGPSRGTGSTGRDHP